MTDTVEHSCSPPKDNQHRLQHWQCGKCGRIWCPTILGWTEVRGPDD